MGIRRNRGLVLLVLITLVSWTAAQGAPPEVRLVHAMPGAGDATLIVAGVAAGQASPGATSGAFVAVPDDPSVVEVMVDGEGVQPTSLELEAGERYDVVLHRGPAGTPTLLIVSALGHVPATGTWLRAVNLMADQTGVRFVLTEGRCSGSSLRTPGYGNASEHAPYDYLLRGPISACAGQTPLGTSLPYRPFGEPPYAGPEAPATLYLAAGPEGPVVLVVDDRP